MVRSARQNPERDEMIEPPTEDEICEALSSLKVNKAGGKNGILPEMVKSCVGELMDYIVDHFRTVWREE